ncbi:MAG: polyprenyl synthetase family protein [Armatimonadota bacterium]|jgi:geranylgeranyl pyrophosphate synthase
MSVSFLHSGRDLTGGEWAAAIADELNLVERTLQSAIDSDIATAYELSNHLLTAGGKRIRPSLLILSALACEDCDRQRMAYLAASTELVHMASLVHDDVIDETRERRGSSTAGERYGNKISVLGGDYLLSKAFNLLCTHGSLEIMGALSATAVAMTESEILQASGEGDLAVWEADYWRIIHGKTADFMGSCCECGAMLAGADAPVRAALREYGTQLGLAFQITDDVLDLTGNREITGKEIGTDLLHGKFTLPVLMALRSKGSGPYLRELLSKPTLTMSDIEQVSAIIIDSGGLQSAKSAASDCAQAALKHLSAIPQSVYKDALTALAAFVISRHA